MNDEEIRMNAFTESCKGQLSSYAIQVALLAADIASLNAKVKRLDTQIVEMTKAPEPPPATTGDQIKFPEPESVG